MTLSDVVWEIENSDDSVSWDEPLRDGQTLQQAYVKKDCTSSWILDETGCEQESVQLHQNIVYECKVIRRNIS